MSGYAKKNVTSRYEDDPEDYWTSNKPIMKPFNFDEDDLDDSIETVNWDGTKTSAASGKLGTFNSVKPSTPSSYAVKPSSNLSLSARPTMSARYSRKPTTPSSVINFNRTADISKTPQTNSQSSPRHENKSISEVVYGREKPISTTDISKLEAEIASLRRQLHQAKRERAVAPSKDETLKRFMVGDTCALELYKSRDEKSSLLDSAIDRNDGNAILAVTLFMRNTLKREIFSRELMNRPVAVDHYCSYLRMISETEELHEMLTVLGRTEEAAMLKYRQCLKSSKSAELRVNSLQDCIKYYFDSDPRLSHETAHIQEQCMLLRRQIVVDDSDKQTQDSAMHSVFKTHPRRDNILHKSVITTLYYCCYYHWGEAEGLLSSPLSIKLEHKISEKQFTYSALAALCRMRRWKELEKLLTQERKLWRSARLYSVIGMEKVVEVLSKNLAPPDILSKYCAEIDTSDIRLATAKKLGCYRIAIDTMVYQKDRQALLLYANVLPDTQQLMRQYAIEQSRKQDVKWKN